eukprot:CAMPEP_0205813212 /NCGR_PEP_ID=MMETSP0205-20121125/17855_1 /ASSEMBLY_ACC=CAM_ASM_000278 /TAXON_ID=36767 /ORGANISM="Euplotes focardii, Strain TN1" /LENGTH=44 /DNA_ID= /DNA_START= /DNA_END= /DNA_ORIENTATION=
MKKIEVMDRSLKWGKSIVKVDLEDSVLAVLSRFKGTDSFFFIEA